MLRPAFGQRSSLHEGFLRTALHGADLSDFKSALRQGAGLIEDHDAGVGQLFQIGRAFDEDAAGGCAADAAEEAQRDGDDQSAGAAETQSPKRAGWPMRSRTMGGMKASARAP